MTTVLLVHTVPLWRASLASLLGTGQGIEVRTAERGAIRA
ncbi:DNA-binding response regulator, partial [Streptomyces globisporus]